MEKDLFGNDNTNSFEVIYKGPSFEEDSYDFDALSKQMISLKNMIDNSIRKHGLQNTPIDKKIRFEKGSLVETIILLSNNPTVAIIVGGTISGLLVHYLNNKNQKPERLIAIENMVAPLCAAGDSISINVSGGENKFYLPYKKKKKYVENLKPVKKFRDEKVVDFIGKFKKIDLNNKTHSLGVDIEGVNRKNTPATIVDKDPKEVPLDEMLRIKGRITYVNDGGISSVEIISFRQINKRLFRNN